MLHGYCVRRAGEPPPPSDLIGVGGKRVRHIEEGGLALWVSEAAADGVALELLRAHERVVRVALRSATPLPLRFGASVADDADAARLLRDRREEFLSQLTRIANRVEMGLRIGYAGGAESVAVDQEPRRGGAIEASEEGRGRAYLEGRKHALQSAAAAREASSAVLDEVETHLADLDIESVRSLHEGAANVGSLAHLVHRDQLRLYKDRMEQLERDRGDLTIIVTGPWAPYSFV